ncbi:MAG TPA: pyruvate kinase [Pirellulales bacterium]|jgi:pyruvate kinase|nr:pyruvate kinase [Pirellulales bacterium]
METSRRAPQRARTKIIATIGPACQTAEQLAELVRAGADLFRLNMAHGTLAEHGEMLAAIRRTSAELRQPIAVLVDLAGPKIRLGELPGGMIQCAAGQEFRFVRGAEARQANDLTTTYAPLVDELKVGDNVMLADGTVSMVVVEKTKDFARCRVVQPGLVRSRQGLNLPGVALSAPAMDETDRKNAIWAAENEIDFVGLSFVRQPRDVSELKNLLRGRGSSARVIAKIEKQEALDHLEGILTEADGVMVARGDLGVEIDVAEMPVVQKRIVATCHEHQKPVIIATQMLDSMQHSCRPTRAEVTDVANAILDGGDACMLSGETAIGEFPREAVEMMNQVALATEELFRDNVPQPPGNFRAEGLHPITSAVVYGAGHIAGEIDARLIVAASHSGATAIALSKQRTYVQTVGVSDSPKTLRQMCLYWGVIPLAEIPTGSSQQMLDAVTAWGVADGVLESGDHIVLVAGIGLDGRSHNSVMVHRVP